MHARKTYNASQNATVMLMTWERRLFSSSPYRLKKVNARFNNKTTKPTEIPPVPPKAGQSTQSSFGLKMKERFDRLNSQAAAATEAAGTVTLTPITSDKSFTTGWGEDKLAPSADSTTDVKRQKPGHDPRVNTSHVRAFEDEVFYRHSREIPHFDRRLQVMIGPTRGKPNPLETVLPPGPQPSVPRLSHSLDKVLFNPGANWLKDPRSDVYNYDPWLENIPDINTFDYGRLKSYVTSSRDETLASLAKREGKRFTGSTSSLTMLLSHIYFLISGNRGVDTSSLSIAFAHESKDFAPGTRWPGGIVLRHQDGVYSIDADKQEETEKYLLLNLGTMLENFLTHDQEDFRRLLRESPMNDEVERLKQPETYRYSKSEQFIMRAQLDAHDPRLPGTGVFDIKTRAAVAIRYDPLNYEQNSGYLIRTMQGLYESFEREYYDLIRSAFLKYLFQVRIGDMDGIFVAYHNTALMFGFQYIPREEMDSRLFGGSVQGDRVFDRCVKCMERIAQEITDCFPGRSVKCTFETAEESQALRIYVEPEEWDEETEGERPIVELLVSATNFLNGARVAGPMDFGGEEDTWNILLNIGRSSGDSSELKASIRTARDVLAARKNAFAFWLPPGMNAEEMALRWVKTDYTGGGKSPEAISESSSPEDGISAASAEQLALLALRFRGRSRIPGRIDMLRKLAENGKKHLEQLKATSGVKGQLVNGQLGPFGEYDQNQSGQVEIINSGTNKHQESGPSESDQPIGDSPLPTTVTQQSTSDFNNPSAALLLDQQEKTELYSSSSDSDNFGASEHKDERGDDNGASPSANVEAIATPETDEVAPDASAPEPQTLFQNSTVSTLQGTNRTNAIKDAEVELRGTESQESTGYTEFTGSREPTNHDAEDMPNLRDGSPLVVIGTEESQLDLDERIISADEPSHQLDATELAEQHEPVVLRSEDQAWASETPITEADTVKQAERERN